jgi:hypothetical protein
VVPGGVGRSVAGEQRTRELKQRLDAGGVSKMRWIPTPRRFPTPVRDHRDFGPVRLMSFKEARWLLPDGEFTYGEFTLVDIT